MITRVGLHVIFVFFVPFGTRDVEYSLVLSNCVEHLFSFDEDRNEKLPGN